MPVRYFLSAMVDVTLPNGRAAKGSPCFRYWDGPPSRISIVKTAGGLCLTRFQATAQRLTEAAADPDLRLLPDRGDISSGAARLAIAQWLEARGLDSTALPSDGRSIVQELARRITGVRGIPLRIGSDDVNGGDF